MLNGLPVNLYYNTSKQSMAFSYKKTTYINHFETVYFVISTQTWWQLQKNAFFQIAPKIAIKWPEKSFMDSFLDYFISDINHKCGAFPQLIQNSRVRLLTGSDRQNSINRQAALFRWLSVRWRIDLKISPTTLTSKVRSGPKLYSRPQRPVCAKMKTQIPYPTPANTSVFESKDDQEFKALIRGQTCVRISLKYFYLFHNA